MFARIVFGFVFGIFEDADQNLLQHYLKHVKTLRDKNGNGGDLTGVYKNVPEYVNRARSMAEVSTPSAQYRVLQRTLPEKPSIGRPEVIERFIRDVSTGELTMYTEIKSTGERFINTLFKPNNMDEFWEVEKILGEGYIEL